MVKHDTQFFTRLQKRLIRLSVAFTVLCGLFVCAAGIVRFSIDRDITPATYSYGAIVAKVEALTATLIGNTTDQQRVYDIASQFQQAQYGVDISHYQDCIEWHALGTIEDSIPIDFVILRATMGINGIDERFAENWKSTSTKPFMRAAYHYFRPTENPVQQAHHFIKHVELDHGDLPPVVDIEKKGRRQSPAQLRMAVKQFLSIIELHYGVVPIVYSGDAFFQSYLNTPEFHKYPHWIANYNQVSQPITTTWKIWQFSEKTKIKGIEGKVDANVSRVNLDNLRIQNRKKVRGLPKPV